MSDRCPLVIAELDPRGRLTPATARAVAALARQDGLTLLVAGHGCVDAAQSGARLTGVARVILVEGPSLEGQPPENMAALLHPMAGAFSPIAAPASAMGRSLIPRLAALLDVGMASEVVAIHAPDLCEVPTHGGNARALVRLSALPRLLTLRPSAFAPAAEREAEHPPAPVERRPPPADLGLSRRVAFHSTPGERPELTSARCIVAGGSGVGSQAWFAQLEALAALLEAGVGATRGAVDAGLAPGDWQIGQTGKVVGPELYVAVGISGAIQHLAGVKDARCIVAINHDPAAPIHAAADLFLVADLREALPKLCALLSAAVEET